MFVTIPIGNQKKFLTVLREKEIVINPRKEVKNIHPPAFIRIPVDHLTLAIGCIKQVQLHFRLLPVHPDNRKGDRKSTHLNSSHVAISYAVFCLKKKNKTQR